LLVTFVPAAHALQMLQLDWSFCISVITVAFAGGVGSVGVAGGGAPTWISLSSDLFESLSASVTLAHSRCWPVGMVTGSEIDVAELFAWYTD
jgi:hypothetical protein